MNIVKYESAIAMEKNEIQMFVSKNWTGDYYAIETVPYENTVTFTIERAIDREENEIFRLFKDLLRDIFGNYALEGFAQGMDIDLENKTIRMISDSIMQNELVIQYLFDRIIFTFRRNPRESYSNNRVILDRDGVLGMGYFIYFKDFFDKLLGDDTRDPGNRSRFRKKQI